MIDLEKGKLKIEPASYAAVVRCLVCGDTRGTVTLAGESAAQHFLKAGWFECDLLWTCPGCKPKW